MSTWIDMFNINRQKKSKRERERKCWKQLRTFGTSTKIHSSQEKLYTLLKQVTFNFLMQVMVSHRSCLELCLPLPSGLLQFRMSSISLQSSVLFIQGAGTY